MPRHLSGIGSLSRRGLLRGAGLLGGDLSAQWQAELDAATYRALLAGNGRTLADADFLSIVNFAAGMYALLGRQDFLMLRSGQNMGTGSTAYTFHGKPLTLVNGPAWGVDEMTFTGVNCTALLGGVNLFPADPVFSLVMAGTLRPSFSGNYGGQFGGGYGKFGFSPYGIVRWSDDVSLYGTSLSYQGVENYTTRKFLIAIHSGQQTGSVYLDGAYAAGGGSEGPYSGIGKDTSTRYTGTGSQGVSVTVKTSFVLFVTADLTAQQVALRSLYKATIGQGLGLA